MTIHAIEKRLAVAEAAAAYLFVDDANEDNDTKELFAS